MEGNGQPQCLSAGTDCYFNMRDLKQLDFDVQMVDCSGVWSAPLWALPNTYIGKGKVSGEMDFLEQCPNTHVATKFAGAGTGKSWTNNANDYTAHTTVWKVEKKNGKADIHVRSCPYSEAAKNGGSCKHGGQKQRAELDNIYGQNACSKGDCVYRLISDMWNGNKNKGCQKKPKVTGDPCKYSVTNIKTKGVPFTGKCVALSGEQPPSPPPSPVPPPPPSPPSSASCDANPGCAGLAGNCCPADDGSVLACCASSEQVV
jgi:hypothetical protein